MPIMFSGLSFQMGMRVWPLLRTPSMIDSGGSVRSSVTILVRWTMTSLTVRSCRSRMPPSMSRSFFTPQPIMGRKHLVRLADVGTEQPKGVLDHIFDRHNDRAEHGDEHAHEGRHQ